MTVFVGFAFTFASRPVVALCGEYDKRSTIHLIFLSSPLMVELGRAQDLNKTSGVSKFSKVEISPGDPDEAFEFLKEE